MKQSYSAAQTVMAQYQTEIPLEKEDAFDYVRRYQKLQGYLAENGVSGALITANPNQLYFTGSIVYGYLYIPAEGKPWLFVKMPKGVAGDHILPMKSPKQLPQLFAEAGLALPSSLLIEDGDISAAEYISLSKIFSGARLVAGTKTLRQLRSVKTDLEIKVIRQTSAVHAQAYGKVKALYRPGMTDWEFSAAVEQELRKLGHQGLFRTFGFRMEAFMGSVLAGENAAVPSPFDFALGGAGRNCSFPLGPCGKVMENGTTVMVDLSNNLYGYLTDMTRTFSIGALPDAAYRAHQVSIDIQAALAAAAKPGAVCSELYEMAVQIAAEAGLKDRFMGREQQAKFVGHGLGIEINEPPVLAPRMAVPLEENMVIALEPKFIIDGVGAVGCENTYVVRKDGLEKLTIFEEEIIDLCI